MTSQNSNTYIKPYEKLPISLCMIVKNEEKNIGPCLRSVKDMVSQMVVVDTGSTDNTVEIARSLGAEISYFEWCDDFSAARNASIERAEYPWILQLDADEEILGKDIQWFYNHYPWPRLDGYAVTIDNLLRIDFDDIQLSHWNIRFFRNKSYIKYEGSIHERVVVDPRKFSISSAHIQHKGYGDPSAQENRQKRNYNLLMEEYRRDPENVEILAYLAQHFSSQKKWEKAAEFGYKALEKDVAFEMLRDVSLRAAFINAWQQSDRELFEKASQYTTVENFPELLFYRAAVSLKQGELSKALSEFEIFFEYLDNMDEEEKNRKVIKTAITHACKCAAAIHLHHGKNLKAITYLNKALESDATSASSYAALAKLLFEEGLLQESKAVYLKLINLLEKYGSESVQKAYLHRYKRVVTKLNKILRMQ